LTGRPATLTAAEATVLFGELAADLRVRLVRSARVSGDAAVPSGTPPATSARTLDGAAALAPVGESFSRSVNVCTRRAGREVAVSATCEVTRGQAERVTKPTPAIDILTGPTGGKRT
jgi:hypothetical protein